MEAHLRTKNAACGQVSHLYLLPLPIAGNVVASSLPQSGFQDVNVGTGTMNVVNVLPRTMTIEQARKPTLSYNRGLQSRDLATFRTFHPRGLRE